MIAAAMLYATLVGILLTLAAVAAERVLSLLRLPVRTVWVVAMFGAFAAVPFALSTKTLQGSSRRPVAAAGKSARGIMASATQSRQARRNAALDRWKWPERIDVSAELAGLDAAFIAAWVGLGFIALTLFGVSFLRLRRARGRWLLDDVDGEFVLVSSTTGPGIIGFLNYEIVVPAWVLDMPADDQALILEHEREHARAHDPMLLGFALVFVALMPWNIALWWALHRLRHAIELDCDRRVLRFRPDRSRYGSLLLYVGERSMANGLTFAALADDSLLLERRIHALRPRRPRRVLVRGVALTAGVIALGCAAFEIPQPSRQPPLVATAGRLGDVISATDTLDASGAFGLSNAKARPTIAKFSLVLESTPTGWVAECESGCRWERASLDCLEDCGAVVDEDGFKSLDSPVRDGVRFRFRLRHVQNTMVRALGDTGTTWESLGWGCSSSPCRARVDQYGISTLAP